MSDTRSIDDKFKGVFGYITDHGLAAKEHDLRAEITLLETALANLPDTIPDASKAYQVQQVDALKSAANANSVGTLSNKEFYKVLDTATKKVPRVRKSIAALHESEARLPELITLVGTGTPDELKQLDAQVAKIGKKAKTAEDQGFLIAAIRARYKIDELSGDLSSGALPQFYKVLGMVPPEHARLNDALKRIHREKPDGTSTAAGGQMNINAGSSARDNDDKSYNNSAGKRLKLSRFDAVTLHEIGHTVDEQYNFMLSKRGQLAFGGWVSSSEAEVIGLLATEIKNSLPADTLDAKRLKWVAKMALISPSGLRGIDQAVANAGVKRGILDGQVAINEATWLGNATLKAADDAIETFLSIHPADVGADIIAAWTNLTRSGLPAIDPKAPLPADALVLIDQLLKEMISRALPKRLSTVLTEAGAAIVEADTEMPAAPLLPLIKGNVWVQRGTMMASSLWDKPNADITSCAMGGFVHQFNQTVWWKYPVGARNNRVSDYQFRSPLEWFAEAYSVFKLGKLSPTHPLYAEINGIDTVRA